MHFKYNVDNKLTVKKLFKLQTRRVLNNITSPWIKPIRTEQAYLFIAGCGHSGTSLVAGKLGRHPDAFLVGRESAIFMPQNGLYAAKKVAREWAYIAEYLEKSLVIEKTPKHVHCIERIWRLIPEAKVILIARNPLDNISSLKQRFGSLDYSIDRWVLDNKAMLKSIHDPRVLFVTYEQLVTNPTKTFGSVCRFSNLEYHEELLAAGPTPFSFYGNERNSAIRERQTRAPIVPKVGVWKERLSSEDAQRVSIRTQRVANLLGYGVAHST